MRTYTGTILFEEALDTIPSGSVYESSVAAILDPSIQIVEDDCGTYLGTFYPLDADLIGKVDLLSGLALTKTTLSDYSVAGAKFVQIRETYSCISSGGLCKKCYSASYPLNTVPVVGDYVKAPSKFFLQIEQKFLDAAKTCPLTVPVISYNDLFVYKNSTLLTSGFTATDTLLTIPSGVAGDEITLKYQVKSRVPFMHRLSSTYGGSLLGMRGLSGRPLPLKNSLHTSLLPEGDVQYLEKQVASAAVIPGEIKLYVKQCRDAFEKALLLSAATSIFLT